MDLNMIIEKMQSSDYRERFKAEYYQLKDRWEKLKAFNNKIEAAQATDHYGPVNGPELKRVEMPKHDCPEFMLREQQRIMGEYLHILEVRAIIEGVEL